MGKIRIISVYPNFANSGGAQDVTLQLAGKLNEETKPIVLTETRFLDIIPDYKERARFMPFNWRSVHHLANKHTIFLSHHRKSTTLLMIFSFLTGNKFHIIHVAHNTFTNLRFLCFFPKRIVAVSNGVKENLMSYFRVPEERITVIFNGKIDSRNNQHVKIDSREIHILLPGRICAVKQQVDMVKMTRGKLLPHIHIYFAGVGEDVELLKKEIAGETQYHYVGFLNMTENLNKYDYVCLFSKNEGLGLSLIEGLIFGKPLITNKLTSVLDVNKEGETGFVFQDFCSLVKGLNELPLPDSDEYRRLSQNARLRYESYFTEEKMIDQYEQLVAEEIK